MTRAFVLIFVTSLGLAARAEAPARSAAVATAGAAPGVQRAWAVTVDAFTKALVKGDIPTLNAMLAPRASVRRFEGKRDEETWQLFERVMDGSLVGQHGYVHPPLVMAADLAADFKNAKDVAERAKDRFVIEDETEMRRANTTAVGWLEEQLAAKAGTPVGVVVLWVRRPASQGGGTTAPTGQTSVPTHEAVFLLLKGTEVGPGQFKVRTVLFGNPVGEGNQ